MAGSTNQGLHRATSKKDDEFYTYYNTIEAECKNYSLQFEDKIIYCCCDNPSSSEFWRYFSDNFEKFKLKELIATGYNAGGAGFGARLNSKGISPLVLTGTGGFETEECKALMAQADIIITNPPFSLIDELIMQIKSYGKNFLLIGPATVIGYKNEFAFIKTNEMWVGYTSPTKFKRPDGTDKKFGNIYWYTNLDVEYRHQPMALTVQIGDQLEEYLNYSNYDAINVNRCANIPKDYDGPMGVPLSFFGHYCPEQFEIIQFRKGNDGKDLTYIKDGKSIYPFTRVIIQKKK